MSRIVMPRRTSRRGRPGPASFTVAAARFMPVCEYHAPTRQRIAIPAMAKTENHAMLCWPRGATMNAARSGPSDDPALPPV